jgi:hypothetical protein
MKWKSTAAFVLLFSLMGSTLLYADEAAQKIKILFNNREMADTGYVIDGKTYVSARGLKGLVTNSDDSKSVSFTEPNVHVFLFKGDTPFGNVNVGKLKFNVFCQVDSLTTSISSIKVAIQAPDGSTKTIQSQDIGKDQKDNFWFKTSDYTYDFKSAGKYTIGVYMKPSKDDDYSLVSEKVITALEN